MRLLAETDKDLIFLNFPLILRQYLTFCFIFDVSVDKALTCGKKLFPVSLFRGTLQKFGKYYKHWKENKKLWEDVEIPEDLKHKFYFKLFEVEPPNENFIGTLFQTDKDLFFSLLLEEITKKDKQYDLEGILTFIDKYTEFLKVYEKKGAKAVEAADKEIENLLKLFLDVVEEYLPDKKQEIFEKLKNKAFKTA